MSKCYPRGFKQLKPLIQVHAMVTFQCLKLNVPYVLTCVSTVFVSGVANPICDKKLNLPLDLERFQMVCLFYVELVQIIFQFN